MIDAVVKSDKAIYVTAPVLVPGEKDCDYCRGETPLTVKQVREYAHSFSNYGFIEKDHDILVTKQTVGKPVESFLTPEPVSLKAVDGSVNKYPRGTWFVKSKITDPKTQSRILNGELNGYSITALPRKIAEEYKASMKQSQGKLLKEIDDPVGFAISLVKSPCVGSAKICNISKKGVKMSEEKSFKEGFIEGITAGFKGLRSNESEYITKDEFDSALKAHTESIEEIVNGAVEKMSESVMKAKKDLKKEKNNEENNNNEEEEEESSANSGNNESNSQEENNSNQNENNNGKQKKKEKSGSQKGLTVGNHTPEHSMKSETEIVMQAMGRDVRGSKLTKID